MKILYLHGLDSHLQDDRRSVLSQYGQILAPRLNYLENNNLFAQLCSEYPHVKAIIGSSAGGLVAYFLAQKLEIPCLIFNPALMHKNRIPYLKFNKKYSKYMQVVLGSSDEVIPYKESLKILDDDFENSQKLEIHIIHAMPHSYPIEIFSQEVRFFFEKIKEQV